MAAHKLANTEQESEQAKFSVSLASHFVHPVEFPETGLTTSMVAHQIYLTERDEELDWLAVFRSAEEKKIEVENAEQGPSTLTYAELRQQNRELKEVVDPTKPLSPYDRLRKQNREVARTPQGQMCRRDAS